MTYSWFCVGLHRTSEPLARCGLQLLSFLPAITSARRVSRLSAPCSRPPFLTFLPHSVKWTLDVSFLQKVVPEFRLHSDIALPDFFLDLMGDAEWLFHTLDVKRALLLCMNRISFPNRDRWLFVSYFPRTLRVRVSSQCLSK